MNDPRGLGEWSVFPDGTFGTAAPCPPGTIPITLTNLGATFPWWLVALGVVILILPTRSREPSSTRRRR